MHPSSSDRAPVSHRLVALAGSLLLAAGLLVAQAPAATAADTVTDLGVASDRGGDVVGQSGRIFVAADDRIVVTKSDGALIDTISGLSGAVALSVADNGRKVYAALRDSHEVIEIDIATLAITKRIDLTAHPCPSTLAQSYERLWVGYGCGQAGKEASSPSTCGRRHPPPPRSGQAPRSLRCSPSPGAHWWRGSRERLRLGQGVRRQHHPGHPAR
ncbi:YncE family protein [Nonomuraea thailandensis]